MGWMDGSDTQSKTEWTRQKRSQELRAVEESFADLDIGEMQSTEATEKVGMIDGLK